MHLLGGIFSYVNAPLWLLFLLTGLLIAIQAKLVPFNYFPAGQSLFPRWPQIDPVRARFLFECAMAVLLSPKLLGCLATLLRAPDRSAAGGPIRIIASTLTETVLAALIAPIAMLTQTMDVVAILRGHDAGWNPQRRDDRGFPIGVMVRRYLPHTMLGLTLGLTAWAISPSMALWMLPVVAGLVLAIPTAALSGSRSAGAALRRLGLLRTPEESDPPPILLDARVPFNSPAPTIRTLFEDPALLSAHLAMLPPARHRKRDPSPSRSPSLGQNWKTPTRLTKPSPSLHRPKRSLR